MNGTAADLGAGSAFNAPSGGIFGCNQNIVSGWIDVVGGDLISMQVVQSSGGNLVITGGAEFNWTMVELLR